MSDWIQIIVAEAKNGCPTIFAAPFNTVKENAVIADIEGETYVVLAEDNFPLDGDSYCFIRKLLKALGVRHILKVGSTVNYKEVRWNDECENAIEE